MAIVDANYEIIFADVGTNGRISDGGVLKNTAFYDTLKKGELNIPLPEYLPGSNKTAPYVFVGDEAFQLQDNFMKPYSLAVLNKERRIFNYRLSRARRIVENFFGILVARFTIFQKPINLSPTKVNAIVLTCCFLHNFLRKHSSSYINNQPPCFNQNSLNMESGASSNCVRLPGMKNGSCISSSKSAKEVRDVFCNYFNDEGKVEWQENSI